tara:strand:+ start:403 stop:609 length:207 start_codon:yes stop_codon:yes gene_type:complete
MKIKIFKNAPFGDYRRKPIDRATTVRMIEGSDDVGIRDEARALCVEFDRTMPNRQRLDGFKHEWTVIA